MSTSMQTKVRAALIKHDLEGLLSLGAPTDEYDNEAKLIAEYLYPEITAVALADIVRDVFHKQFDGLSIYEFSDLLGVASDILED